MTGEFRITADNRINGTPEQVWEAVTTGNAGWLWPMEFEPKVGGAGPFGGVVTVWEPPTHIVTRVEQPDWFNELDFSIEPRDGGAFVRFVHSGIFAEDWDNQYDGALKHTAFYQHTLREYVEHFAGRQAVYVEVRAEEGNAAALAPDAFDKLKRALSYGDGRVDLPGVGEQKIVVDFETEHFLGLRSENALYRYFGRNAWGDPVGLTLHIFDEGVDAAAIEKATAEWLTGIYT